MSIFTTRVADVTAELLDRGVPEAVDLLAAMDREISRLDKKVKDLEAQLQTKLYGDF